MYQAQKHRGTEGFGFFDKTRTRLKRATKERKILAQLKNAPSSSILFHHRFPTSTKNVKNACHPFSTKDFFKTNYVLIHNGHISNAYSLQGKHFEDHGIEYHSTQPDGGFNDSESLLWDVALYLEGKQDKLNAYGNIAFIVLAIPNDKRRTPKLHFGRNVQPLNIVADETMILLASELEGDSIERDQLYTYNYKTKKLTNEPLDIPTLRPYVAPATTTFDYGSGYPYRDDDYNYSPYDWDDELADVGEWIEYEENGKTYFRRKGTSTIIEAGSSALFDEHYDYPDFSKDTGQGHVDIKRGRTDISGLTLLPRVKAEYTWQAVTGEDMQDIIYTTMQDQPINVKQTVIDRLDGYLEAVDGNYQKAFDLMGFDIAEHRQQLIEDEADELMPDEELVLELDLLTIAQFTLTGNPGWITSKSEDKTYRDIATQATMGFLATQQRQRLTAGAAV